MVIHYIFSGYHDKTLLKNEISNSMNVQNYHLSIHILFQTREREALDR